EIETAEERAAKKAAEIATEETKIATKIEMIENMFKIGLPIEKIAKVAELSVEEVNEIIRNKR
ncbi:ATPase, partial [Bacillus cereus]